MAATEPETAANAIPPVARDRPLVATLPRLVAVGSPPSGGDGIQAVMQRQTRMLLLAAALLLGQAGCASLDQPAVPLGHPLVQAAPLGSRIRRDAPLAPVGSINRTQVEQMEWQQGAAATGHVQRNP